jgi:hypothetical protein
MEFGRMSKQPTLDEIRSPPSPLWVAGSLRAEGRFGIFREVIGRPRGSCPLSNMTCRLARRVAASGLRRAAEAWDFNSHQPELRGGAHRDERIVLSAFYNSHSELGGEPDLLKEPQPRCAREQPFVMNVVDDAHPSIDIA